MDDDMLPHFKTGRFVGSLASLRRLSHRLAACVLMSALLPLGAAGAEPAGAIGVANKRVMLTLHAEGVQIYQCEVGANQIASWVFREPLATLLLDGKTVGHHFAGPSWEMADGSMLVGKVVSQEAGKTKADIPLLKLDVASRVRDGALSKTTAIQRIATRGGVFAGPCQQSGAIHLEPYSADYVFLAG